MMRFPAASGRQPGACQELCKGRIFRNQGPQATLPSCGSGGTLLSQSRFCICKSRTSFTGASVKVQRDCARRALSPGSGTHTGNVSAGLNESSSTRTGASWPGQVTSWELRGSCGGGEGCTQPCFSAACFSHTPESHGRSSHSAVGCVRMFDRHETAVCGSPEHPVSDAAPSPLCASTDPPALPAGLRGAIPYALSLHLDLEPMEKRQLIGTTTIIIVLFTILLLGGSTMPLIRLMDIEDAKARRRNKKDVNLSKTEKMVGAVWARVGRRALVSAAAGKWGNETRVEVLSTYMHTCTHTRRTRILRVTLGAQCFVDSQALPGILMHPEVEDHQPLLSSTHVPVPPWPSRRLYLPRLPSGTAGATFTLWWPRVTPAEGGSLGAWGSAAPHPLSLSPPTHTHSGPAAALALTALQLPPARSPPPMQVDPEPPAQS